MDSTMWTTASLCRLFRFEERRKSIQVFYAAEQREEIPRASRRAKGKVSVREWKSSQVPAIGSRFGYLKRPQCQEVICIYTAKGGVLKTTTSYNLARSFALNGIKTIIIGLDIQCSVTDLTLPQISVESLEEVSMKKRRGLYHYFYGDSSLQSIIIKTELPTLDIIPENHDLNGLEMRLRNERKREYIFSEQLISKLEDYEVIIFDNGPSWNLLVENALASSTTVVTPAGCDLGTYQALRSNLQFISDFKKSLRLAWRNFFITPTLIEKTKISQQIYGAYLNQYGDSILPFPIRRAVAGQEALVSKMSSVEYSSRSKLAADYYEMVTVFWEKVLDTQTSLSAA